MIDSFLPFVYERVVFVFLNGSSTLQRGRGRVGVRSSRIWKSSCILVHRSKLAVCPGVSLSRVRPVSVFLLPLTTYF